MDIINKISTSKVLGKLAVPEEPTAVMRIVGHISAYKNGSTSLGEYVKFVGEFKATNLLTGQIFFSPNAFLPGVAEDVAYAAIKSVPEGSRAAIAFDFAIIPSDTPTGYEWSVRPLIEQAENDPLKLLEQSIGAPQIAAPKEKATKKPK